LEDLAAREEILIACDVDGVLAPFVDDPSQARALPASLVALERLAALPRTRVALVSGRSLPSLRQVAQTSEKIMLVGGHGSELATGDPVMDRAGVGEGELALAERVASALEAICERIPGSHVERKPASATLHTRVVPPALARRAEQEVLAGPARWEGVVLMRGKDVLELSVSAATKGTALQRLRQRLGIAVGGVAYLGDDVTDEAAFAVLDQRVGDVAVKVGEGSTCAGHRLSGPDAVADVLQWLAGLRVEAATSSRDPG
jgi:trehalose-phosphatase